MSVKKTCGIFLLFWLCGNSLVWAESWREVKDPRERSLDRIQMIRMWRLVDTLRLDKEASARFFATTNYYEETKKKLIKDINEDTLRLRSLMRDMNPPDKELKDILLRIKNRRKDLLDLTNRQTEEEMNLLRLEQQARYILFQIDFQREMDEMIREIRGERPPRPGVERPPERIR